MKIPEAAAPSYYGDEVHWQSNGMIAEPAGQYSGVPGTIPTPVYPAQIRGHMQPGYMGMPTAYYPIYASSAVPPPSIGGPLSPPEAAAPPHAPSAPHHHPIDFSEYMWMENEEEFDKQVMQQLEEEALMEQCIEAMLEDERERHHHRYNGRHTNGVERARPEVSKSTLNPLAAEFVPGGGYTPPASTARAPSPPPLPQPTPTAAAPASPEPQETTAPEEISAPAQKADSPVSSQAELPQEDPIAADEKAPSQVRPATPEEKPIEVPEPKIVERTDAKADEDTSPAVEVEQKEKSIPAVSAEAEGNVSPVSKSHSQPSAWKEMPSRSARNKPTMADVVGSKKERTPVVAPVAGKPARESKATRSEPRVPAAAKVKDARPVKSEPRIDQKLKETSLPPTFAHDKPSKEELIKQTTRTIPEAFVSPCNHTANSQIPQTASVAPPQNVLPKPINYAEAAKANRSQLRPQAAPAVPATQPSQIKKAK